MTQIIRSDRTASPPEDTDRQGAGKPGVALSPTKLAPAAAKWNCLSRGDRVRVSAAPWIRGHRPVLSRRDLSAGRYRSRHFAWTTLSRLRATGPISASHSEYGYGPTRSSACVARH